MTMELPSDLWLLANQAAENMGLSLNTWLMVAVCRMTEEEALEEL